MIRFSVTGKADIDAIEKIPLQQRCPAANAYELIKLSAERHPDSPAIRFLPTGEVAERPLILTYREFLTQIHQVANLFFRLGIGRTDVVSCLLPNLPQTHLTLWGGEAAGIINPVNPMLEPAIIADILNEADSRILVVPGPSIAPDIWRKVAEIAAGVRSLKYILCVGPQGSGAEAPEDSSLSGIPVMNFDRARAAEEGGHLLNDRKTDPQDICACFHTGGTTGRPKLAQHSHMNQMANTIVVSGLTNITRPINSFVGLPLFHVNAVIVSGLSVFANGGCVTLLGAQGFRTPAVIGNFWKLVEKYRATQFSCVPTVLTALLNSPADDCDISSLEFIICGAAPLSVSLCREFEGKFNVRVMEGYGLTEGTCVSSFNPLDGERRIGSIGIRLPYQPMKTVIIDEAGKFVRDCECDEVGVIVIKGPNIFPGYRRASANKKLFVAEGWLNTGDLGRQDAEGYFWLAGRSKDLIIRGGHNIDPGNIESCLAHHPAVADVAAIGQPDAYAGELPCAYITLKTGQVTTPEELRNYAGDHIQERAAIPVYIEILAEMPLTAVGKIFKPALRRMATERVITGSLDKAGIAAAVTVRNDEKYGLVAAVKTAHPRHEVQQILGKFAFRTEVATARL